MTDRMKEVKVSEIMNKDVVTIGEDTGLRELKTMFEKYDFNAFPVTKDGILVGVVTKLDLLKTLTTGRNPTIRGVLNLWAEKVGDIMRKAVVTVKPSDDLMTVAEYMVEFKLRSIPVVENMKLVGIVSRTDLMPYIIVD